MRSKGVSIVKQKKTSEGRALWYPSMWRSANEEKPRIYKRWSARKRESKESSITKQNEVSVPMSKIRSWN